MATKTICDHCGRDNTQVKDIISFTLSSCHGSRSFDLCLDCSGDLTDPKFHEQFEKMNDKSSYLRIMYSKFFKKGHKNNV